MISINQKPHIGDQPTWGFLIKCFTFNLLSPDRLRSYYSPLLGSTYLDSCSLSYSFVLMVHNDCGYSLGIVTAICNLFHGHQLVLINPSLISPKT